MPEKDDSESAVEGALEGRAARRASRRAMMDVFSDGEGGIGGMEESWGAREEEGKRVLL